MDDLYALEQELRNMNKVELIEVVRRLTTRVFQAEAHSRFLASEQEDIYKTLHAFKELVRRS